jgi:hypothetical protein
VFLYNNNIKKIYISLSYIYFLKCFQTPRQGNFTDIAGVNFKIRRAAIHMGDFSDFRVIRVFRGLLGLGPEIHESHEKN